MAETKQNWLDQAFSVKRKWAVALLTIFIIGVIGFGVLAVNVPMWRAIKRARLLEKSRLERLVRDVSETSIWKPTSSGHAEYRGQNVPSIFRDLEPMTLRGEPGFAHFVLWTSMEDQVIIEVRSHGPFAGVELIYEEGSQWKHETLWSPPVHQ